jgi:hypothetical protein
MMKMKENVSRWVLVAWLTTTSPVCLNAFLVRHSTQSPATAVLAHPASELVRVGDLLSDLPTPSLLLELSLAEGLLTSDSSSLDDILKDPEQLLRNNISLFDGSLFIHTTVADTTIRDAITEEQGSGKSQVICQVDVSPELIPGGAYLGIGLANHHVGGYYWARGMGIGASLPAHGIAFRPACRGDYHDSGGELYWKKRGPGMDAKETTEESSNSNDGKRSEWADFVAVGDTVQLVPETATEVLLKNHDSPFSMLLGVRRIGRPLGADPIVEKIWVRSSESDASCDGWIPLS